MDSFEFSFNKIVCDYETLLENGNLSDVILVAGDKELKVHKVVLSARSPVFDAMFTDDSTKEAKEIRVEITDVVVEILELLVRYIYTDKVEMLKEYSMDLLVAADKYQLDGLKSICERHLLSQISTKSFSDLLIFADMYNATKLYSNCLDYIVNNVTEVMASKWWMTIAVKADLLAKLYENLHLKYSKLSKFNDYKKKVESNWKKGKCHQVDWTAYAEISTETVLDLFIHADMHCATELYTRCLDYIIDNGTEVMATEGWNKIQARADYLDMFFEHLCFKFDLILHDERQYIVPHNCQHDYNYDFCMYSFKSTIYENMSKHYESILESGKLSDVILAVEDKELCAHKVILSARSQVFRAMFAHDSTKESQENRVVIIDVNAEVLKLFIKYIYTGKVGEFVWHKAAELFVVADKYQLECLKSICEKRLLFEAVTTESVSDLLILSDMYQITELNTRCVNYIANYSTQVIASKGWNMILTRADLLAKLYERLHSKMVESMQKERNSDINCTLGPAEDLLVGVDKYQVDSLKSICKQQLLLQITTESVSNLLINADMHSATEFATHCLDYITDNSTQVMASVAWKKILVRADLLAKLFKHLSLKYTRAYKRPNSLRDRMIDSIIRGHA